MNKMSNTFNIFYDPKSIKEDIPQLYQIIKHENIHRRINSLMEGVSTSIEIEIYRNEKGEQSHSGKAIPNYHWRHMKPIKLPVILLILLIHFVYDCLSFTFKAYGNRSWSYLEEIVFKYLSNLRGILYNYLRGFKNIEIIKNI